MPVEVGWVGVYVMGRWNALQLSGCCHKALCLITNKHWFNQGPECFRMDRLQLSFSLWGIWTLWNCSCVPACMCKKTWLGCLVVELCFTGFNKQWRGSLFEEVHHCIENNLVVMNDTKMGYCERIWVCLFILLTPVWWPKVWITLNWVCCVLLQWKAFLSFVGYLVVKMRRCLWWDLVHSQNQFTTTPHYTGALSP